MATDIGRINVARSGIKAVDFSGKEKARALSALDFLEIAVLEAQLNVAKSQAKEVAPPEFLRCAADYQDAPYGTRVAKRFGSGWWRKVDDAWIDEKSTVMPGRCIAFAPRKVVEWGDA